MKETVGIIFSIFLLFLACGKAATADLSSVSSVVTCPTASDRTLCGLCDTTNLCRYCVSPSVCKFSDVCTDLTCPIGTGSSSSSSSSSSTTSSSGSSSTSGGGNSTAAITTCSCPGNLQCSQKVGCIQTCTCYYTINGSDANSAWYRVGTGPNGTGTCYLCDQNGLGANCSSAANTAANAVAAIIAGGGSCTN